MAARSNSTIELNLAATYPLVSLAQEFRLNPVHKYIGVNGIKFLMSRLVTSKSVPAPMMRITLLLGVGLGIG
jgi:hypothetical protein